MSELIECLEDGADPKPYNHFIKKNDLAWNDFKHEKFKEKNHKVQ